MIVPSRLIVSADQFRRLAEMARRADETYPWLNHLEWLFARARQNEDGEWEIDLEEHGERFLFQTDL